MSDQIDEVIGWVSRSLIESDLPEPSGFRADPNGSLYRKLVDRLNWGARAPLEQDPSKKQLIPYIICRSPDGRIFTMRRTDVQREERLHDKISIGVGGHLEQGADVEEADRDAIEAGMRREFREEVSAEKVDDFDYLGILNDDTNEVGRVHLGVVYTAKLASSDIRVRETEKMAGEWRAKSDLAEEGDRLESWSRIVIEHLLQ